MNFKTLVDYNPGPKYPPLEVVGELAIERLDEVEREMYKQKLRIEVAHFKQRQQMYAEKRAELLELE